MAPEAKTSKVKKTKRTSSEAIKTVKGTTGTSDEEESTPPASKSKLKARPKTQKSATKVKRPKSRQKVMAKEKLQAKAKAKEDTPAMDDQREQVYAVLDAICNKSQCSRTKSRVRSPGNDRGSKQSKTSVKGKVVTAKPKTRGKNKSDKKCKRPKSRPKSRGQVPACKSSKGTTQVPVTKSSGKVANVGGGASQTTQGGNTQIFILGSPSDPAALELLQNLVLQMKTSAEAKEQPAAEPPSGTMVTDQAQLEELYDAMHELTTNVRTIQDSYEKIINSLVTLQQRRKGKKAALIPTSAAKTQDYQPAANILDQAEPGDIAAFMNAATRNEAFEELFARVDALKTAMEPFCSCFDDAGFFNAAAYEDKQITEEQRQSWLAEIRPLAKTVEALLAEYNREVLDMFRIESNLGSNCP